MSANESLESAGALWAYRQAGEPCKKTASPFGHWIKTFHVMDRGG